MKSQSLGSVSSIRPAAQEIPGFDLRRSLDGIHNEIHEAISRVIHSGQVILGEEGRAFETEFADFVGAAYAVGTASGTDALILALKAVGIGSGDEVITVANTAVPTASAIRAVGAVPRFVDIDERTLLINSELVESAINERTRGILPVHLYGQPVPLNQLISIARKHSLSIIEDCSHAHGASEHGIHVGTQGNVGCFSFYPTKNLGALGDAGICVTQESEIANRMRALRMYGFDSNRIATCDGINSRLDEIQAAVLRVRLRHLDQSLARRQAIAARYIGDMSGFPIELPAPAPNQTHAWHQFVIRVRHRERFMRTLMDYGIGASIHYEHPLHRMPAFARWFTNNDRLPVTEEAATQIVSIPNSPWLTSDECHHVVAAIHAACFNDSAQQGDTV